MLKSDKTFDGKVKKLSGSKLVFAVIFLIIAIVFGVAGIMDLFPKKIDYVEFDKTSMNSNYVKTKVYYLIGPILYGTNSKTQEIYKYYSACDENEEMFLFVAKEDVGIPVLGQDINEEDIPNLELKEVYGTTGVISDEVKDTFIKKMNAVFDEELVNDENFDRLMGGFYFNGCPEKIQMYKNFFAVAGICMAVSLVCFVAYLRLRKRLNEIVEGLKDNGVYEKIVNDYESGRLIEYKKLGVDVSPKYIFSYNDGLDVICFKDIREVYATKRVEGNVDRYKYIVVETKGGEKYCIAPQRKRSQKIVFDELLAKIKSEV